MKSKLTAFFFRFFNSNKLDLASRIAMIVGAGYFIAQVAISIISKW